MSESQPPWPPSSIAVDGELGDEAAHDDGSSGISYSSSDSPPDGSAEFTDSPPDGSAEITTISNGCKDFKTIVPMEWDGANPDAVLAQLKALKEEALTQYGLLKSFYKSYYNWSKLKPEQQNKALAWFWRLPEHIQCQL